MPPHTYISVTRKPLSLKPFLRSPGASIYKLLLPSPLRAGRCLLPFLAFWALLSISQLHPSLPISCSPHLHHVRLSWRPRRGPVDEFWKWAQSEVPQLLPCTNYSEPHRHASISGKYMLVVVSGGLNQQRNQIIDAVVVARILEAVLVVPVFQVNQVWGDDRSVRGRFCRLASPCLS